MISRGNAAAVMVLMLGAVCPVARAQGRIQFAEYSSKFLCGVVEEKGPGAAPVGPGIYETSVNIHNAQIVPANSATFVKKGGKEACLLSDRLNKSE